MYSGLPFRGYRPQTDLGLTYSGYIARDLRQKSHFLHRPHRIGPHTGEAGEELGAGACMGPRRGRTETHRLVRPAFEINTPPRRKGRRFAIAPYAGPRVRRLGKPEPSRAADYQDAPNEPML